MITSIITFIIVLSILVLVHEAGHFFAARRAGIWVEEFGFGLPPRLFGKKRGETIYSINLLPFGGFVRLHGENTQESITDKKRAFLNQSGKVRTAVILAGVIMNFVLAIASFSIVYSFTGIPKESGNVKVVDIRPDSPASKSGLEVGDVVKKIDGTDVTSNEEFISYVEKSQGSEIVMYAQREDVEDLVKAKAVPRVDPPPEEGSLGVIISSSEIYYPPIWQRPFVGIYHGFKDAFFWTGIVLGGFVKIFTDLTGGTVPTDVAGPVGIFALTSEAAKFGILTLINFIGILSVNLAIINVIPFPALDGGRLLFIAIEKAFGKKVLPRVETAIHTMGMILLLLLIFAITAHDVVRLISAGSISGYIDSVIK
ncbi:RIP metalloprotease [Patescibacteria group bacterium]